MESEDEDRELLNAQAPKAEGLYRTRLDAFMVGDRDLHGR
jgi:hypothetical protein